MNGGTSARPRTRNCEIFFVPGLFRERHTGHSALGLILVRPLTFHPSYFPILGLFQYGAASFLYELWPNGNEGYVPNLHNTATL